MTTESGFVKPLSSSTRTGASEADWSAVYKQELPRIYNFFRYRVGNNALAEDLTSTTFEKAWRARERYRHDLAAFSTWLLTIARNVATDHFRQPRLERPLDDFQQQPDERTTEKIVERRDEFGRLAVLLAQLPDRERELVSLKYGAELSNREIARMTRLSESNVGTILHRVIQRLRQEWE